MTKQKVRVISGVEAFLADAVNKAIAEEFSNGYTVQQIIPLGDSAEIDLEDTSTIRTPIPMVMLLFTQA